MRSFLFFMGVRLRPSKPSGAPTLFFGESGWAQTIFSKSNSLKVTLFEHIGNQFIRPCVISRPSKPSGVPTLFFGESGWGPRSQAEPKPACVHFTSTPGQTAHTQCHWTKLLTLNSLLNFPGEIRPSPQRNSHVSDAMSIAIKYNYLKGIVTLVTRCKLPLRTNFQIHLNYTNFHLSTHPPAPVSLQYIFLRVSLVLVSHVESEKKYVSSVLPWQ